jgi:ABC-type antimicrobial peptide transport system permease subunit
MGIFGFQFSLEGILPAENLMPTLLSYLTYVEEGAGIVTLLSVAVVAFYAARLSPAEALKYEV